MSGRATRIYVMTTREGGDVITLGTVKYMVMGQVRKYLSENVHMSLGDLQCKSYLDCPWDFDLKERDVEFKGVE